MAESAEEALRHLVDVLGDVSEERVAAVRGVLAADVVWVTPIGKTEGADAVVAALAGSPLIGMVQAGTWSELTRTAGGASVRCTFRPGGPIGGITVEAEVSDGVITTIDTTFLPATSPEPIDIDLTGDIASAVGNALTNGTPVVVAYVDEDGQPQLSLRGSAQVLDSRRMGVWARNAEGGLPTAVVQRPRISLWYRDPATRTAYQFHGLGRVETDEQIRKRIYENSPEIERNLDADRRGAALVIDVTRVEGRDQRGSFIMVRGD